MGLSDYPGDFCEGSPIRRLSEGLAYCCSAHSWFFFIWPRMPRGGSYQKAALLHKVNRVFGVLLVVATLTEKLHVVVSIRATQSKRHDVIELIVITQRLLATCALAFL